MGHGIQPLFLDELVDRVKAHLWRGYIHSLPFGHGRPAVVVASAPLFVRIEEALLCNVSAEVLWSEENGLPSVNLMADPPCSYSTFVSISSA